jgi:hypothetical protein
MIRTVKHEAIMSALEEWRGSKARLWQYHPSLSRVVLMLYRPDSRKSLYVLATGARYIQSNVMWDNSCLEIAPSSGGDSIQVIRDLSAEFELRCDTVTVVLGTLFDLDTKLVHEEDAVSVALAQKADMDDMMLEVIEDSFPLARTSKIDDRYVSRRWLVRSERKVTQTAELELLKEQLMSEAGRLYTGGGGRVPDDGSTGEAMPDVTLTKVDDRHCVVSIEVPTSESGSEGGAAAEVIACVLRRIDRTLGIESLQGVPRRFWSFLKSS